MSDPPRTAKMLRAYREQKGGRRNGSILITYVLGVILVVLAPVLYCYAAGKDREVSAFVDPVASYF